MGAIHSTALNDKQDNEALEALMAELSLDETSGVADDSPYDIIVAAEPLDTELEIAVALAEDSENSASPFAVTDAVAEKVVEAKKPSKKAREPSEKKAPFERKHYANKVERLSDTLGANMGDYLILEIQDALLEGDALKAKQAETLVVINEAGKKVQNRQTFILEFVAGKSATLNNVIQLALNALKANGTVSMNADDVFFQSLLAKPYTMNAARAMGNNTLAAMRLLKMVKATDKGYAVNPQSVILAKLAELGVYSL